MLSINKFVVTLEFLTCHSWCPRYLNVLIFRETPFPLQYMGNVRVGRKKSLGIWYPRTFKCGYHKI